MTSKEDCSDPDRPLRRGVSAQQAKLPHQNRQILRQRLIIFGEFVVSLTFAKIWAI
jgi:hypothetical protein